MRALLFFACLTGCATTNAVSTTAAVTLATVQTVDDGWTEYTKLANAADLTIAQQVVKDCAKALAYDKCAESDKAKLRAKWDKADVAFRVYTDALHAGGSALGQKWTDVLTSSLAILKDFNIFVVGGVR